MVADGQKDGFFRREELLGLVGTEYGFLGVRSLGSGGVEDGKWRWMSCFGIVAAKYDFQQRHSCQVK